MCSDDKHLNQIDKSIGGAVAAYTAMHELKADIVKVANVMVRCLDAGGRIYLVGNGGSAADAQHIAAELQGRFLIDRPGLGAIALTTNTSTITAISNDYSFKEVFVRQIEGLGRKGDLLICISTSGNSENLLRAAEVAKQREMGVVSLTGANQSKLQERSDFTLKAPSKVTARIQECHILIGHLLCEVVESAIYDSAN